MIRPGSRERSFRTALLLLSDFSIAWASLAIAVYVRRTISIPLTRSLLAPASLPMSPPTVLLFGGTFVIALALAGFYRRRIMSRARPMPIVALVIQVGLVTAGAMIFERQLPRTILLAVPLFEALLFPLRRSVLLKMWPLRSRATILVGEPPEVPDVLARLERVDDPRIRVIAYAGSRPAEVGTKWIGNLEDLNVRAAVREAEEVICLSPDAAPRDRLDLLRIRGPRGYLLLASSADALLISPTLGWIGDEPLIEVSIACGLGAGAVVKRTVDVVLAITLLVLALPLWIVVAIALLLSDGRPVLLRQMRLGLNGVPFGMWKFRTMRLEGGTQDGSDEGRVTRVGRLLRRYRFDELPQLLNVITGDMSLVGPRPERPEIAARILGEVPDFDLRCLVRPGIAGLAQILAEYECRPEIKLRYDLTYMCSWSLWLDVRLLLSSVATALSGSGV